MLGIAEDYEHFDTDIIIHINSVLSALTQIGVGPEDGFTISGKEQTWSDFLGERKDLEEVRSYVYMRVRMLFDPPTSSSAMESMKALCQEFEWRLNVAADNS